MDPPSFKRKNIRVSRHFVPNIGIAYVAAKLLSAGYKVSVLDPNAEGLNVEKCSARLGRMNPWAVGISAMTHNITDAGEMSGCVKKLLAEIPVVLGGVHAAAAPGKTMEQFGDIDFEVFGEGEETAVALFGFLSSGSRERPKDIKGVAYRSDSKVLLNQEREGYVELDDLPFPAWELFPLDRYAPMYKLCYGRLQLPISTSRGCPYACVFCNNVNGRKMRYRAPEGALGEIERNVRDFDVGSLQFVDEALTMSMERAARLCELMIEKGYGAKIKWLCQTRADRVSPELLKLMKGAGCEYISVGIESGNQEILDRTGKELKLENVREAVDWITKAGITADVLFLIGLPYETPKTIFDTIRFAKSLNTKFASFSNAVPFPGTKMREMGENGEGGIKLLSSDWTRFERHVTHAMELETVSLRRLKFYHFLAHLLFYFTPGRIGGISKKVNIFILPRYFLSLLFQSSGGR